MLSDQDLAHYVESVVRQTAERGGTGISAEAVVRAARGAARLRRLTQGAAHPQRPRRAPRPGGGRGPATGGAGTLRLAEGSFRSRHRRRWPRRGSCAAALRHLRVHGLRPRPSPGRSPLLPAADAVLPLRLAAVPAPAAPPRRASLAVRRLGVVPLRAPDLHSGGPGAAAAARPATAASAAPADGRRGGGGGCCICGDDGRAGRESPCVGGAGAR
ncbi:hypothetical protein HU200_009308 [Digitaria exilis]|uniref:Uncharacterized protein n=1 Tax=Digitaria exilis TaxID=1010633 RepID=A0A835FK23_9POAL|nr:hypothetical protein HU200_009308 [Digitaria exilis]